MIKCRECNAELNRIQWTHLRNKCTGNLNSVNEYKQKYPDAPLVDEEIAKLTAVTQVAMIRKYGEEEGQQRWEIYRTKQAASNSFEYKKEKHGWSKEQFDEYNSSRAQTIEKMIARHGEEIGTQKWLEYCERQSYTNTKEYFVEKYGKVDGEKKYLKLNREKSASVNPKIMSEIRGITMEEALEIVMIRYSRSAGFVSGSKLEKEFAEMLSEALGPLENTTMTKPFGKWSHLLNSYVIYDIQHQGKIIEFNGDYWHANPKLYKDDAVIRGRTAKEIQHYDKLKIQTAENLGFECMTIWESEFNADKTGTINKVKIWMQTGQK
jgi:very-short-patch-repair endonuclease